MARCKEAALALEGDGSMHDRVGCNAILAESEVT